MLLSIIVPAYNVESYIHKCIESIIQQKNIEFEVIIVNDGSSDNTLREINKLYEIYPNIIRVINQKNKGLGGARNTGIRNAKGKYVAFVDSDDYLIANTFSDIFSIVNNEEFDIICYKHIEFYEGQLIDEEKLKSEYSNKVQSLNNIEAQRKLFVDEIKSYSWDKIYRLSLFKGNSIEFSENTYYEDLRVTYELISEAKKVAYVDYCGYLYLQRANSITKTFTQKHVDDFIIEYSRLLNKITNNVKQQCQKELITYKILKRNSIIRTINGLGLTKYNLNKEIDIKVPFKGVITNKTLGNNEKIIYLFGKNKFIFSLLKSINGKIKNR